jgi:tRNA nucleotidyltransferase (CCA-adding enzyme)
MTKGRWEHLEHGADIGIRGFGSSLAEAFAQAALAVSSVVTELDRIDPVEAVTVECEAPESDLLLVDWINEIVYQMATRNTRPSAAGPALRRSDEPGQAPAGG